MAVRTDAMLGIDLVLVTDDGAAQKPLDSSEIVSHSSAHARSFTPQSHSTPPQASSQHIGTPPVIPDSFFHEREPQASRLSNLQDHHARSCSYCLRNVADHPMVFGEGNSNASLMFIGEAPGTEEERQGRPFAGRAGVKLDEMIKAMGLQREDVYITNALKSRPLENRPSEAGDFEHCGAYLAAQVRIIKPEVIVVLGGPASKLILGSPLGITSLRGKWAAYENVDLMPTFHPAYLLRNPTLEVRGQVWKDLQEVMKRLGLPLPARD